MKKRVVIFLLVLCAIVVAIIKTSDSHYTTVNYTYKINNIYADYNSKYVGADNYAKYMETGDLECNEKGCWIYVMEYDIGSYVVDSYSSFSPVSLTSFHNCVGSNWGYVVNVYELRSVSYKILFINFSTYNTVNTGSQTIRCN